MFNVVSFTFIFMVISTANAYAYLDFGTGSYIFQIVSASLIGFVVVAKNHFQWIKQLFKRKKPDTDELGNSPNNIEQ